MALRTLVIVGFALCLTVWSVASAVAAQDSSAARLRVAVAPMMSPRDTFSSYHRFLQYMGKETGMEVDFVQRKTHAEVGELLRSGAIDMAFICSGPYALSEAMQEQNLLVMPVVQGSTTYHSYIIVHADSTARSLADLRGTSFAFTDPDSNTGYLSPLYMLRQQQENPEGFFGSTMFTHSHDNSILAVARGLVNAAAVNSLVWDYCAAKRPEMTARTKVLVKSVAFAMPPVVTSARLDERKRVAIKTLLLNMHQSEAGLALLRELRIDRFVEPQDAWYTSVRNVGRGADAPFEDGVPHGKTLP